ncbi:MAG: peptide-methionine (S)-S-oxide reductase MsrA [Robiginitomaculum sp.]
MQNKHFVNGKDMYENYPDGLSHALLGLGCFWGAERLFWELGGVYVTSVGYGGGGTDNPDYEQVCLGTTGHAELVYIVFSQDSLPYAELLKIFFESHDPTQGNRQGNDTGTQYRSIIYTHNKGQEEAAKSVKMLYDMTYKKAGKNPITTQILPMPKYYPAENYHQQYLAKNPDGYCHIGGTGINCPILESVDN